jgi:DNA-binding response OmpR family regulator
MTRSKRILIVEDDRSLAEVLANYLRFEGFDVTRAETGDSALGIARTTLPDLILLDVMLPGMNGFELISLLRRHRRGTSIVMLTAKGQKADRLKGLNLGADDYITKPFDLV